MGNRAKYMPLGYRLSGFGIVSAERFDELVVFGQ